MACAVTDFPLPDSPTRARISLGYRCKLISFKIFFSPKESESLEIDKSGFSICSAIQSDFLPARVSVRRSKRLVPGSRRLFRSNEQCVQDFFLGNRRVQHHSHRCLLWVWECQKYRPKALRMYSVCSPQISIPLRFDI